MNFKELKEAPIHTGRFEWFNQAFQVVVVDQYYWILATPFYFRLLMYLIKVLV